MEEIKARLVKHEAGKGQFVQLRVGEIRFALKGNKSVLALALLAALLGLPDSAFVFQLVDLWLEVLGNAKPVPESA